jgi:cobalt/nickel transport system permease protein
MLLDDRLSTGPGLLQRLDARIKVPALIGILVFATLLHSLPGLAACYGIGLALAFASRVPARRIFGAWLIPPLLTALTMLPAALNAITPGQPVLPLWGGLAITDTGLLVVTRFVLRTLACVTLTLLLMATTRPARLFQALRLLGMPQAFVMMLAMLVRYLAVIARAAEEIHLAKLSRTLAPGTLRQEQAWVAAGMGALFRRTQALGEDVYLAMLARGYTGDTHLLDEPRIGRRDWAFLAGVVLAGVGIWVLDWMVRGH